MFNNIQEERMDSWWNFNETQLARDPEDWHALAMRSLMENEYRRRGWAIPAYSGKKPPEAERLSPYLVS